MLQHTAVNGFTLRCLKVPGLGNVKLYNPRLGLVPARGQLEAALIQKRALTPGPQRAETSATGPGESPQTGGLAWTPGANASGTGADIQGCPFRLPRVCPSKLSGPAEDRMPNDAALPTVPP